MRKKFAPYLGHLSDSAQFPAQSNKTVPGESIPFEKSTTSRRDRLGWALRDKARALVLVDSLGALVQKLHDLIPPGLKTIGGQGKDATSNEELNSWKGDTQKILLDIEKQIHNETRKELSSWLDAPDTKRTYDEFILKRLDGTCDWILDRPEVRQWQLFAPGNPKLIEDLSTNSQANIAYFFFSSESESRADPFAVIKSWILQLLSQSQHAFDLTREKWESTDGRAASRNDIKELFDTLIQSLPPCAFVVDGLDECAEAGSIADSDHQGSLLEFLKFLTHAISKSKSQLLVVSRNDLRIREGLSSDDAANGLLVELRIYPKDVKADAIAFCRSIVNRKLANKCETQREELAQRLVHRCEYMFLSTKLSEEHLRAGKNLKQLQRAIDQAPDKLDHIYDRNWDRIQRLDGESRARALSVLRWVTYALRPLTVAEITECLLLPDEDGEIDYEELPDYIDEYYLKTEILGLCGSLIEVRATESSLELDVSTIHLTHFSVRQYILCHLPIHTADLILNEQLRSSNESIQHNILASACLRYLNCNQTWEARQEEGRRTIVHAFRGYAADLWFHHIKRAVINSDNTFKQVNAFFRPPNPKWDLWLKHTNGRILNTRGDIEYSDWAVLGLNVLSCASILGLMETVDYLIENVGFDVDCVDAFGRTALMATSFIGCVPNIVHLLQKGANVNITDEKGFAPLHFAAYFGNAEVTRILAEYGARLEIQNNGGETPLSLASQGGFTDVMECLLDKGADIHTLGNYGATPLHYTAFFGQVLGMQLLLERGANPHNLDNGGNTPLLWAVYQGNMNAVRLLLDCGSRQDAAGSSNLGFLITAAAMCGKTEVVDILLESGIFDSQAAFRVAAYRNHTETVHLLLEKVADPHLLIDRGWEPLHFAAGSGHVELVKIFLTKGADLHVVTASGQTAWGIAAELGLIDVIELFLENGLSVESTESASGYSLLSYAARSGQINLVKYLLQRGANPNSSDNFSRTPLFYAAISGNVSLFGLILSQGSGSVNLTDRYGSSLLSIAARHGHIDIVARLLACGGIDVNSKDNLGRSVSFWASTAGVLQSVSDTAARHGIVLETSDDVAPIRAPGGTTSSRRCDVCTLNITVGEKYYHCSICSSGDFDICGDCYALGASCSHELVEEI
ncbi:hypothetical protein EKO27_g2291 [Xylaria grammica]|uniref:Uncharacterized protein n=1 Tax=Xylaria grammica TaxID=363999 RepID=A0A439DEI6_9PEZI|nr:hypothetical protein EKO27_g2291 [Xylaria grammica]